MAYQLELPLSHLISSKLGLVQKLFCFFFGSSYLFFIFLFNLGLGSLFYLSTFFFFFGSSHLSHSFFLSNFFWTVVSLYYKILDFSFSNVCITQTHINVVDSVANGRKVWFNYSKRLIDFILTFSRQLISGLRPYKTIHYFQLQQFKL